MPVDVDVPVDVPVDVSVDVSVNVDVSVPVDKSIAVLLIKQLMYLKMPVHVPAAGLPQGLPQAFHRATGEPTPTLGKSSKTYKKKQFAFFTIDRRVRFPGGAHIPPWLCIPGLEDICHCEVDCALQCRFPSRNEAWPRPVVPEGRTSMDRQ